MRTVNYDVIVGDCVTSMKSLDDSTVNTIVTSPPYFGLRDYGVDGQIGLESDPIDYIDSMVAVFREARRVLRDDGTLWLNMGDSYGKGKQLLGIPWRLAFALQADGWILRQDIIWHKPNPMPESVRDRCTKAHEYVFLFSKSQKYFYNAEAIKTPVKQDWGTRNRSAGKYHNEGTGLTPHSGLEKSYQTANKRSVWSVSTKPFKGAHFATFPPELIEPCILAGCPVGGTVLDPFGGSGTTAGVAVANGRNAVICELNPAYADLVAERVQQITTKYEKEKPSNDNNPSGVVAA